MNFDSNRKNFIKIDSYFSERREKDEREKKTSQREIKASGYQLQKPFNRRDIDLRLSLD